MLKKIMYYDNNIVKAFVFTVITMLLGLIQVHYHTNDDIGMRMILEGSVFNPPSPSEYVLFMNVILCRMFTWLYTICPQFFWYDSFFYLCIFGCFFALFYYFLFSSEISKLCQYLVGLVLLVYGIFCFNNLQFTIVSGLLALTSVVLYWRIIFVKIPLKHRVIINILIFLFICLACLIRFEMALLLLFLGGVFTFILDYKFIKIKTVCCAVPIILAIIASFGMEFYHKNEYAKLLPYNPLEYNAIKSEMLDKALPIRLYKNYYEQKVFPLAEKNNISENDLKTLMKFGFTGSNNYSLENMKKYNDILAKVLQGDVITRLMMFKFYFTDKNYHYAYPLFLILLCILIVNSPAARIRLFLLSLFHLFLLFILLPFMKLLPLRVLSSIYLLELLCTFYICSGKLSMTKINEFFHYKNDTMLITSFKKTMLFSCSFPLICYLVLSPFSFFQPRYSEVYKMASAIAEKLDTDTLYNFDSKYSSFISLPFKKNNVEFISRTTGLGWGVALPFYHEKLNHKDFYDEMAKGKIKVISKNPEGRLMYYEYIKEHICSDAEMSSEEFLFDLHIVSYQCK